MRFHVSTLLGKEEDQKLPRPAGLEEMKTWMSKQEIDRVEFDVDFESSASGAEEGNASRNGPWHLEATPVQLSVMRQMMKAVGVTRFCPDFSLPASRGTNKWLWDLAVCIFIKLVQCGEYTGIPVSKDGILVIKKSFNSHIQSLMKKYVSVTHYAFDSIVLIAISFYSHPISQIPTRKLGCFTEREGGG